MKPDAEVMPSAARRYGVAIAVSAFAIALSIWLDPLLAGQPFQIMLAAVLVSAWYGGLRPALLSTALNALVLDYYFLAPRMSFGIATIGAATRLAVFLAVALMISSLNDRLRRAYQGAETARRAVQDLANIVASSDDAIVGVDPQGRVTSWNHGAERLLGRAESEVLGASAGLLLPPGHGAELPRLLEALQKGGRLGHFETTWITKSERPLLVSVRLSPTLDAAGRIAGASIIARDVGTQREGELAVSRLASIVASAEEAIIAKSLDGTIVGWNPAAERLYRYPAAEVVGKSIHTIVPEERRTELGRAMERVRAGERVDGLRTERVRKDGLRVQVVLSIAPVRDSVGNVVGASTIARAAEAGGRRRDEMLRDLVARLASSAEPQSVVELAIASLRRASGADRAALLRWDDASGLLAPYAASPVGSARSARRGEGAVGRAFDEGRTIVGRIGTGACVPQEIATPISRGQRVLGVVSITVDSLDRTLGVEDGDLVDAIAALLEPVLAANK